ncbi:hypothetical protein [Desulfosporosinus orientis]|nr:hypothetical protein [Desulfosporosinus orientis]
MDWYSCKPEIMYSDQGSRFYQSGDYLKLLDDNEIRISMDAKAKPWIM